MTPLRFEELYGAEWDELEGLLDRLLRRNERPSSSAASVRGDRLAALYRRACEQLALARARAYPAYLVSRLDRLTSDAHQVIYQRREIGLERLARLVTHDFPRAVRAQASYVWIAAVLLAVPTLVVGWLVYSRPELILSVVNSATAAQYERMYSDAAPVIGSLDAASSNWLMFGYYISHNIGIAFQCFAGGLFAGVGSLFFLAYNGVIFGAVGGYLTERGHAAHFYSFVVTHGAFELTAIVLSGAAGLKLGHAWLSPGRYRRIQSLVLAAKDCALIVYGVIAMLVIAAAIEAFWSSAAWLPHAVKYGVAAICWAAVLGYLGFQGRHAR
ncbi:MAG TPA: stage II sporulation protein M [Steroidobacteraceae bacterium]|nr:stage II sporulation protein M [Steroidobacteraceae bacterium]